LTIPPKEGEKKGENPMMLTFKADYGGRKKMKVRFNPL